MEHKSQQSNSTTSLLTGFMHTGTEATKSTFVWLNALAKHYKPAAFRQKIDFSKNTPVLLIPGFLMGDYSLEPTHQFLLNNGFYTQKSGFTYTNAFINKRALGTLENSLRKLTDDFGKVNIVGHSLGGSHAMRLAMEYPEYVNHVITMGSPLNMSDLPPQNYSFLRRVFHAVNSKKFEFLRQYGADTQLLNELIIPSEKLSHVFETTLKNVRFTSIHSPSDHVIPVSNSLIPENDLHKNVRLSDGISHMSMAIQNETLSHILQELTTT